MLVQLLRKVGAATVLALILMISVGFQGFAAAGGSSSEHRSDKSQGHRSQDTTLSASDALSSQTSASSSSDHSDTTKCNGDPSGNSGTGSGANSTPAGPYTNTCPDGQSGNGNGGGISTGKPCAGCVGNADDKNPPGQYPGPSDHNNGYECDGNHGIARTNPAHTGCSSPSTSEVKGSKISIGSVDCDSRTLSVTFKNENAATTRSFTITPDWESASTVSLAAGASRTMTFTVPSDASHTITVTTSGNTKSKTFPKLDCSHETPTFGSTLSIGSVSCTSRTANVLLLNSNSAASRTFTVSLDGVAQTITLAAGQSQTIAETFANDGPHSISASSVNPGGNSSTKVFDQITDCTSVLGESFTKSPKPTSVLGVSFTRALPFTGIDAKLQLELALMLLIAGVALERSSRRRRALAAGSARVVVSMPGAEKIAAVEVAERDLFGAGWDGYLFD
ncbi:MAG: hypothetical protein ABR507_08135 [Actinomycetota bacterium]